MTLRPTPEATYILAAPRRKAQRGTRKPDPWRYLKRLGDIDEARRRRRDRGDRRGRLITAQIKKPLHAFREEGSMLSASCGGDGQSGGGSAFRSFSSPGLVCIGGGVRTRPRRPCLRRRADGALAASAAHR